MCRHCRHILFQYILYTRDNIALEGIKDFNISIANRRG